MLICFFFLWSLHLLFSVAVSEFTNLIGEAHITSYSRVITLAIYLWRD